VFIHPVIPSLDVTRSMVTLYNAIYRQVVSEMLTLTGELGTEEGDVMYIDGDIHLGSC
jgi:hypothetical protein